MTLLRMTFHESYGELPVSILRLYRRHNVSQSDHDIILANFGKSYGDVDIPWGAVLDFVLANVQDGTFRLPIYM
jgi:hypothetical protein